MLDRKIYLCADSRYEEFAREQLSNCNIDLVMSQDCDVILLVQSSNRILERKIIELHKNCNQKPIYVVCLYAIQRRLPFMDEHGEFNFEYVERIEPKEAYWVHLETHINDHCNLNCKACNNYAPFCREKVCSSVEQFKEDCKAFAARYRLGRFFLLGGEPLLEPGLAMEFMQIARRYFPQTEIRLLTNGLLVDRMGNLFWACMRDNDIVMDITVYPPLRDRLQDVQILLDGEQVKAVYWEQVETFEKKLRYEADQDPWVSSERCGSAGCHYLRDGWISKCPDAMLVEYMDKALGTSFCSADRMQLEDIDDSWKILEKMIRPIDLCAHCAVEREKIPWGVAGVSPRAEDWIISQEGA